MLKALCIAFFLMAGFAVADEDAVTPEREAAAMTFAKRHHPELHALLVQLKQMDTDGYETAIRELFQTSERLAKVKSTRPDRYETDLAIWKIDSRVRLMAVQSRGSEKEARAEIKKLLLEKYKLRVQQMKQDRDRLEERIKKMNETIDHAKKNSDKLADREIDRLFRTVRTRQNNQK